MMIHETAWSCDSQYKPFSLHSSCATILFSLPWHPAGPQVKFHYISNWVFDKDKYLYIVDVINTRVQELNPSGLFVAFIGGWGVEKGEFFRPKGVALDRDDRIYTSDSYMGVIQVFEPNGEFYSAVGDSGSDSVKKFKTPTGIFIDKKNRLYAEIPL